MVNARGHCSLEGCIVEMNEVRKEMEWEQMLDRDEIEV